MIKLNQNQYIELNKKYDYQSYELAKDVYLFGAASRQAEIDELNGCVEGWKSEYNSMCKRFERSQEINKEIQNRIESITETLIDHLDYEYDELDCPSYDAMLYALREVKEILKGEIK